MMYGMVVRRLKPGAYEHFRRAWEPDSLEHWPAGMTRIWIARSEDDPDVIATWSLFELDEAGYEALRDDPEWMSAELGRVERMSEFEAELLASGFFRCWRRSCRRPSQQTERQSLPTLLRTGPGLLCRYVIRKFDSVLGTTTHKSSPEERPGSPRSSRRRLRAARVVRVAM